MTDNKRFDAAVKVIKGLPKDGPFQPSNQMKLKFYALYKQATEGPCSSSKPGFWEAINRAKWNAWHELKSMTREEAMDAYVDELATIIEGMSLDAGVASFLEEVHAGAGLSLQSEVALVVGRDSESQEGLTSKTQDDDDDELERQELESCASELNYLGQYKHGAVDEGTYRVVCPENALNAQEGGRTYCADAESPFEFLQPGRCSDVSSNSGDEFWDAECVTPTDLQHTIQAQTAFHSVTPRTADIEYQEFKVMALKHNAQIQELECRVQKLENEKKIEKENKKKELPPFIDYPAFAFLTGLITQGLMAFIILHYVMDRKLKEIKKHLCK